MAGANKQIAELTQALHEAREYGAVLADGIKDKDGIIRHLKTANNRLRTKLAETDSALNASQADLHEVTAAASVTAENRDFYKGAHAVATRQLRDMTEMAEQGYQSADAYLTQLNAAEKDANSWKRGFFLLVAITVIAQVVNYVAG
nr:MAG: hypothetical protein [Bacteriophage sp.]